MQSISCVSIYFLQGDNSNGVSEEETKKPKYTTEQVFVAFARVFSGTVKRGQKIYVLGPKHDPAKALDLVCV